MHWFKLSRSLGDRKVTSLRRRSATARIETLERRQLLSIDPVAAVAPAAVDSGPVVLPLAIANQSIQDSWQVSSTTSLSVSETTGEKPQSKVWTNAGEWFAVLPNSSGTWIWRLDNGGWTPLLKLSSSASVQADVKAVGNVTHVLLFDGGGTQLSSVQYIAGTRSYEFWSARPGNVSIALPGSSETATIDIDSLGRMWLAYENKSARTVEVRYSDGTYSGWSAPITVASGLASDDISGIVAMNNGQIGVFWSNQNARRFGFRTHTDGANATQWNAFEVPAEQSAKNTGHGMADDHFHLAAASDGTLFAAVKTGYDSSNSPEIALLVRRPNGSWDSLYEVSGHGTRPTIVLNEQLGRLIVAYTEQDGGGDILYRETSMSSISFGPVGVMIGGGSYNNVTTTKQSFVDEIFFVAATSSKAKGTLLVGSVGAPTSPTNQPPTVSAGPDRTTVLGTPVALAGTASDDGLPSATLSLQWSMVSGPGFAAFGNTNQASTNVTFSAAGTYVLRLTASDGSLATSDDVVVNVTATAPVNQAPQVLAGPDVAGQTGAPIALAGSASDDGQPSGALTAQWSVVSGPGAVSFGNANAASTSATFNATGTYVLRLSASDGTLSSSDDVSVTVTAPSTPGIVGFWNFKAGIGAGYPSSIGNLGSLQGGATVSADGRLNLSGSGQRYAVPDVPELQISQAITISAWIKPSTRTTQYIARKAGNSSTDGFELSLSNGGTVFARFNESTSGDTFRVDSTAKYPTNGSTWMHVAATYDGSTIRLYINGQQQGSKSANFKIGTNNLPLNIGSGDGGYRTMKGQLDEVLVTNRALSASEISQVYIGSFNPGAGTPTPTPVNQAPQVNAGPDQSAQVNAAVSLAGSASDDGQPSGTLASNWSVVSGPGSVAFGNSASPATSANFATAGTYLLRLSVSDGALSASDDVVVTVNATTPINQAPSVSAGPDRSVQAGSSISLAGSATDDGLPSGNLSIQWTVVSGPGVVGFGSPNAATTSANFATAGSYVLRLTAGDGVLSASDDVTVSVTAPPATSSGVVGFWNFDSTNDSSGQNNNGSLQGGATLGAGHSGGGLQLNGANQRMVVPDAASLDVTHTITIAAWIKPSASGTQYIVKKATQDTTDGYELSLSGSGTVFVRFNQDSAGDSFRVDSTAKYPTNGSTWMHVAATYDGSTIRLYINGQLQGSRAAQFTIGANDLPLGIGAEPGGYRSMRGAIDDVLVANRALNGNEVLALYQGSFI